MASYSPENSIASLSLEECEYVDQICLAAERAWQSGNEDRIEERICDETGLVRDRLLVELLLLELHYRHVRGESPTIDLILERFPNDQACVNEAFARVAQNSSADPRNTSSSTEWGGSSNTLISLPPRYEAIEEIARGGMGHVWRVNDKLFNRKLAVKVMSPKLHFDRRAIRRFVMEAQLTGSLQHPAIPPVVDRGELDHGLPFFSMKLVEGSTLRDVIKRNSSLGPESGERSALLSIFEQVCQAVGYAHSMGFIHRDPKTANIMVGEFGEVHIMDWGMAKRLAKQSNQQSDSKKLPRESTPNRTVGGNDHHHSNVSTGQFNETSVNATDAVGNEEWQSEFSELTRDGSVMGTPAYMPPEQAAGLIDSLDCRSDVFSLGAILVELLTGQPPYVGTSTEALDAARLADVTDAMNRLNKCDADKALIQIVKNCVAKERASRFANANEVATSIREYMSDVQERLRTAELKQATAQTKAQGERRARRLRVGIAGLVVAIVIGAGSFTLWQYKESEIRQLRESSIESQFDSAIEAFRNSAANRDWESAAASMERAEGLLSGYESPAMSDSIRQARGDYALGTELENARLEFSQIRQVSPDATIVDELYRSLFSRHGFDISDAERLEASVKQSSIQGSIVDAFIFWGLARARDQSSDVETDKAILFTAKAAAEGDWHQELIDALVARDPLELNRLSGEELTRNSSAATMTLLAEAMAQYGGSESVTKTLIADLLERNPDDFWANNSAGIFHATISRPPNWQQAARYFTAAHALQPENIGVLINLCNALERAGDYPNAVRIGQRAIAVNPQDALAHANLGNALCSVGELDRAEEVCKQSLELDPELGEAQNALGRIYLITGKLSKSETYLRLAIEQMPEDPSALGNLGAVLTHTNPDEAVDVLARAIEAFQLAGAPATDMAIAYTNLGSAYVGRGDTDSAIEAYRKAIDADPDFAAGYYGLGNVYFDLKRLTEARDAYLESLAINPNYSQARWNLTLVNGLLAIGVDEESEAESDDD